MSRNYTDAQLDAKIAERGEELATGGYTTQFFVNIAHDEAGFSAEDKLYYDSQQHLVEGYQKRAKASHPQTTNDILDAITAASDILTNESHPDTKA